MNPTARRTTRRAFTLIEMLIVIVLLGIASALVIPAMGSVGYLRVHGALRTIVADITFAQSDAIAFQQPRAIDFDLINNTYSLVQITGTSLDLVNNTMYDPGKADGRYVVDFRSENFGGAQVTAAGFGSTGTGVKPSTLIFDEMGTPVLSPGSNTPSNGGTIVVTAPDNSYSIVVEAYTGRVTVRKTSGN
ncbi:MAG: pilus assembly FimT family protein [Phycisphaerales bacterium]